MQNNELHELACEIVRVLDKQQEYFKTRDRTVLAESKKMESDLRKRATEIAKRGESLL